MKLEFAIFAHAAEINEKGYINMLGGGFDVLRGTAFPGIVHSMNLIVRLLVSHDEFDQEHTLRVLIIGPDSEPLPTSMETTFVPAADPRDKNRKNRITLNLAYLSLTIPMSGNYIFKLFVGGQNIGEVGLEAVS